MAHIGRGFPSRPVVTSRPHPLDAVSTLGVFAVGWEFPELTVTTPSVTIGLDVFAIGWEFPPLTVLYDTTIGLGVFSVGWEFPELTVDVPILPGLKITRDGEIEWRGELFSLTNQFTPLADLTGWEDHPGLASGNSEKAQDHGSEPGQDFAEERVVSGVIQLRDDQTFPDSLKRIRRLLTVGRDETEYPLVIRLREETLLAYGKINRRVPTVENVGIGVSDISAQWICSDPGRYSLLESGIHVTTASPGTVSHDGDVDTKPRLRFHGPAVIPRVRVAGRTLAFNVVLAAGEIFNVDCKTGTTIIGVLDYVPLHDFSVPITDFEIPPGDWEIVYDPDSGGDGGMDVFWRDRFM
ncbi:hypothetical protein ACFYY8_31675 [Streptosporangium sp. NPDC001559]|uniref:hypothetical protein n=1 Tax=Streptosporangium sp. NPDC001559 TaxID=3366187 RepID=UPI0036EED6FB